MMDLLNLLGIISRKYSSLLRALWQVVIIIQNIIYCGALKITLHLTTSTTTLIILIIICLVVAIIRLNICLILAKQLWFIQKTVLISKYLRHILKVILPLHHWKVISKLIEEKILKILVMILIKNWRILLLKIKFFDFNQISVVIFLQIFIHLF